MSATSVKVAIPYLGSLGTRFGCTSVKTPETSALPGYGIQSFKACLERPLYSVNTGHLGQIHTLHHLDRIAETPT